MLLLPWLLTLILLEKSSSGKTAGEKMRQSRAFGSIMSVGKAGNRVFSLDGVAEIGRAGCRQEIELSLAPSLTEQISPTSGTMVVRSLTFQ